jgi:NADH dehydrogenase (ubiquinone) 1 alpha subcomplex subunit 4
LGVGVAGAGYYILRLATRCPDVSWSKKGNLEPWQEYADKQYKVIDH